MGIVILPFMPKKIIRAHFFLFLVNFLYGANYLVAKLVMPAYILPTGFILLRVVITTLLFFLVAPLFKREKIDPKDFLLIAICGLTGVALNQVLFFKGLALTSPINASIIMTTTPVLVLIVAAVLIKERITLRKVAGIVLGSAGALMLLTLGKTISFNSDTFRGDLLVFLNALSYGVFLVIVKPLMKKYHPITIIKWVFLAGLIFVLPFGYHEFEIVQWDNLPVKIWWSIVYVVIGTTFIAYLLNTVSLNVMAPSVVSIYIYLQPLVASGFALFYGQDDLSFLKIISALLIFAGVYLVSSGGKAQTVNKIPV
jgi:drug/metabolite transporter (DMT)-like permease